MSFRFSLIASLLLGVVWAGPVKKLIVLGQTGAGKSSLCNELTGTAAFQVGHDLESCTSDITTSYPGYLFGNQTSGVLLSMTDTGGLGDSQG